VKELTTDSFFDGRIKVKQHRRGYRFSIDAVLLASFVKPRPGDRIVDLGTGCGIILLIVAFRHPTCKLFGVEVQEELAGLAEMNVRQNRMENQIRIICEDMKNLNHSMVSGAVDIVIANPPYRRQSSGRLCRNHQRAQARHELSVTLPDVIETASRLLRNSGRFALIYLAERIADVLGHMRAFGIEPKFLRSVHPNGRSEAKLLLVEGIKGAAIGLKIAPPLIIHRADGEYTEEVQKMLSAADG